MNKGILLGYSAESIAIILDMLYELEGVETFKLYANIETSVKPFTPLKDYSYEIMPLGSPPEPSSYVFFGSASPRLKEATYNSFLSEHNINEKNYRQILHPTAYIAPSSNIADGVLIEPMVVISSQSSIGFGVFVKRGSLVGHHNKIGRFTDINPGVVLSGKITIGENCIIGSGTVAKDNITIGSNTIIGVGSVVTKDIPANCVAYGNPCSVRSARRQE